MDIRFAIDFWHWWIVSGIFVLLEIFVSGFFFIWLALSAEIVGVILMLLPMTGSKMQLVIFSMLSVTSINIFRAYQRSHPSWTDQPELNRRSRQYIRRTFTLDEPIVNGVGKLHMDDTTWRITGENMPAGHNITVVGILLKVEKGD